MWARHIELCLGLWLAISPFVFHHPSDARLAWATDLVGALLIVVLALASYARRARYAHLLELLVAAWLVGYGWLQTRDLATPAAQNHILVGLLLTMFAIVPARASQPPPAWREGLEDTR